MVLGEVGPCSLRHVVSWCWSSSFTRSLSLSVSTEGREKFIYTGPPKSTSHIPNLGNLNSFISPHVRNLGVVFDNSLKFDKQISAIVGSNFFPSSFSF